LGEEEGGTGVLCIVMLGLGRSGMAESKACPQDYSLEVRRAHAVVARRGHHNGMDPICQEGGFDTDGRMHRSR
jgi:hypothetical protein